MTSESGPVSSCKTAEERSEVQSLPDRWPTIEAKLLASRDQLARSAAINQRKLPSGSVSWVVRVWVTEDGRRKHRNIYLGSVQFAERARTLVAEFQRDRKRELLRRKELLMLASITGAHRGWSRADQQRLRKHMQSIMDDRPALLQLGVAMSRPSWRPPRPGRKPRPRSTGLW